MTAAVVYRPFRAGDLAALVDYWRLAFADRRNFVPVDEATLRERVLDVANAVERFDPEGLVLALDPAGRPVGLVHAGVRDEAYCRACHGEAWPGGSQGYVALLHVLPAWRRQGVGGALLDRARAYSAGAREVVMDGTCINPYYGNSEAPFTPLWGTPEGPGVSLEDRETASFLERRGHPLRHRAVTLEAGLDAPLVARHEEEAARAEGRAGAAGYAVRWERDRVPVLGGPSASAVPYRPGFPYHGVFALRGERVVGSAVGYPMTPLGPHRAAIYELKVLPGHEGQGLGRALAARLLVELARAGALRVEVLTIPELSPAAHALYLKLGLREVAWWAIY